MRTRITTIKEIDVLANELRRAQQQRKQSPQGRTNSQWPSSLRKVRGKRGFLARLADDVPLDVIFEIFCYLDPGDLLRLARTSNDLRCILISKSSESIWRTARGNVRNLPPRPDDLNEPQYAHLLYESYCHICNHKGRCDTVVWTLRKRCCRHCASTLPMCDNTFLKSQPSEYRDCSILPTEWVSVESKWNRRLVVHVDLAARLKAEFETLKTSEARTAWISAKKDERRAQRSHNDLCERWLQGRLDERTHELEDIRKERKEAILNRLKGTGWYEEAKIMIRTPSWYRHDEFSSHKLVRQAKKLTEYGWNSIKDELVEMLSEHRVKRLATERKNAASRRYESIEEEYTRIQSESDLREPFPAMGDVVTHRLFEDIIWDTPADEDLTGEFFRSKLLEHLPSILDEWRPTKIQELVEIMRKSRPGATTSDLHLATSVFKCKKCFQDMHYPQMFYHECCFRFMNWNERLRSYSFFCSPWSSQRLVFDEEKSEMSRTIVERCSLDPAATTVQDLYSTNPLIECTSCDTEQGRVFMRWPLMILRRHSTKIIISESIPLQKNQLVSLLANGLTMTTRKFCLVPIAISSLLSRICLPI
ncbi:hypothetical protein BT96DRAFT_130973 [Gymnopus androsaceus JB14]|uniref:F-box domain-containing protein n=1 Tax=Gymnopus androsaceus JB14 TaxID=1447944 RepID=A0A6A4IFE7_9AGAR|nr:hypothetical protein BT96DRAFT_130973 [Gymnopus androsaceus JB14]